jgi:hypothetical protein
MQYKSPHPTSTRSILILSIHLCLGLSSGLLPSGFPIEDNNNNNNNNKYYYYYYSTFCAVQTLGDENAAICWHTYIYYCSRAFLNFATIWRHERERRCSSLSDSTATCCHVPLLGILALNTFYWLGNIIFILYMSSSSLRALLCQKMKIQRRKVHDLWGLGLVRLPLVLSRPVCVDCHTQEQKRNKSLSPRANYTDKAYTACRRS